MINININNIKNIIIGKVIFKLMKIGIIFSIPNMIKNKKPILIYLKIDMIYKLLNFNDAYEHIVSNTINTNGISINVIKYKFKDNGLS
jgi:hypothetical protein